MPVFHPLALALSPEKSMSLGHPLSAVRVQSNQVSASASRCRNS